MQRAFSLVLYWLQSGSGLTVDGSIPVWGLLIFGIGIIVAAVTVKVNLDSLKEQTASNFEALKATIAAHEKSDEKKFESVLSSLREQTASNNEMFREIRDHVTDIRHNQNTEPSVGAFIQSVMDRLSKNKPEA